MKIMKIMRGAVLACTAAALSACSATLPVRGDIGATKEAFTGTATGYMDGSGTMLLDSSLGAKCAGNFVYTNSREGDGVMRCDDGRSGTFTFSSTGSRGVGSGKIADQAFTFTFGK